MNGRAVAEFVIEPGVRCQCFSTSKNEWVDASIISPKARQLPPEPGAVLVEYCVTRASKWIPPLCASRCLRSVDVLDKQVGDFVVGCYVLAMRQSQWAHCRIVVPESSDTDAPTSDSLFCEFISDGFRCWVPSEADPPMIKPEVEVFIGALTGKRILGVFSRVALHYGLIQIQVFQMEDSDESQVPRMGELAAFPDGTSVEAYSRSKCMWMAATTIAAHHPPEPRALMVRYVESGQYKWIAPQEISRIVRQAGVVEQQGGNFMVGHYCKCCFNEKWLFARIIDPGNDAARMKDPSALCVELVDTGMRIWISSREVCTRLQSELVLPKVIFGALFNRPIAGVFSNISLQYGTLMNKEYIKIHQEYFKLKPGTTVESYFQCLGAWHEASIVEPDLESGPPPEFDSLLVRSTREGLLNWIPHSLITRWIRALGVERAQKGNPVVGHYVMFLREADGEWLCGKLVLADKKDPVALVKGSMLCECVDDGTRHWLRPSASKKFDDVIRPEAQSEFAGSGGIDKSAAVAEAKAKISTRSAERSASQHQDSTASAVALAKSAIEARSKGSSSWSPAQDTSPPPAVAEARALIAARGTAAQIEEDIRKASSAKAASEAAAKAEAQATKAAIAKSNEEVKEAEKRKLKEEAERIKAQEAAEKEMKKHIEMEIAAMSIADASSLTSEAILAEREAALLKHAVKFDGITLHDCEDLSEILGLEFDMAVEAFEKRFESGHIFTFVGNTLMCINPFKTTDPAVDDVILKSMIANPNQKRVTHVFWVAAKAYQSLMRTSRPQTIVLTGESGAGKTYNTRRSLEVLTRLGRRECVAELEGLLGALESFGNAATTRNRNSSRYGRYLSLSYAGQTLASISLKTFLLELVRVPSPGKGERNYHVFYEILAGCWMEGNPEDFAYLSASNIFKVRGVDDKTQFQKLVEALKAVGISEAGRNNIFSVCAGILHLGNVKFQEADGAIVVDPSCSQSFKAACDYLAVTEADLERVLSSRTLIVVGNAVRKSRTLVEAAAMRDTIAQSLYNSAFEHIVGHYNDSPESNHNSTPLTCGLLDIFGFESFQHNSLEQMCINYANERLQRMYVSIVLEAELALLSSEGVGLKCIDIPTNSDVIELFDRKVDGIFAQLNDECLVQSGAAASLCIKIRKVQPTSPNGKAFFMDRKKLETFGVMHFCGPVTYECKDLIPKNRQMYISDVDAVFSSSSNPVLSEAYRAVAQPTRHNSTKVQKPKTVTSIFKGALDDLDSTMCKSTVCFVKCIKSNPDLEPGVFDKKYVVDQLRVSGYPHTRLSSVRSSQSRIETQDAQTEPTGAKH